MKITTTNWQKLGYNTQPNSTGKKIREMKKEYKKTTDVTVFKSYEVGPAVFFLMT